MDTFSLVQHQSQKVNLPKEVHQEGKCLCSGAAWFGRLRLAPKNLGKQEAVSGAQLF